MKKLFFLAAALLMGLSAPAHSHEKEATVSADDDTFVSVYVMVGVEDRTSCSITYHGRSGPQTIEHLGLGTVIDVLRGTFIQVYVTAHDSQYNGDYHVRVYNIYSESGSNPAPTSDFITYSPLVTSFTSEIIDTKYNEWPYSHYESFQIIAERVR